MKALGTRMLAVALSCATLGVGQQVAQAKTVTEDWAVAGMHSGADVEHVRVALLHLPGITRVEVTQATVELTFDNQSVNERQIRAAIAHAGDFQLRQRID